MENALHGSEDEVSADLEEANGSLAKTDTGVGVHEVNASHGIDASSAVNVSELEQTSSDPQDVTGSEDQRTPGLPIAETPEGDQPHLDSSDDNVEQTGSPALSAKEEDGKESGHLPTFQAKQYLQDDTRPEDLSTSPALSAKQEDGEESAHPSTVHAKQGLNDDSRPEDLPSKTKAHSALSAQQEDGEGSAHPPPVQAELDLKDDCRPEDFSSVALLGGPALSARQEDEGEVSAHLPTAPGKQDLKDDARAKDLFRNFSSMAVLVIAVIIGLYFYFNSSNARTDPREESSVDIFCREFDKIKSSFPSQRPELWKRSKIHLERHLQTAEPTEPVSMILTSGRGSERTLHCLARRMAAAFSSALGASVLHINGASMASLESDQVKLDIDQQLTGAFEGDQRAAVIHRFEELPPGSTLIFYRYCDHENAAYKNALLVFTVLLQEDDLKSHLSLSAVEEIVQDDLQDKFVSSSHSASFDKMDVDKLSGLWSRISHLILPVATEESIEEQGCMT